MEELLQYSRAWHERGPTLDSGPDLAPPTTVFGLWGQCKKIMIILQYFSVFLHACFSTLYLRDKVNPNLNFFVVDWFGSWNLDHKVENKTALINSNCLFLMSFCLKFNFALMLYEVIYGKVWSYSRHLGSILKVSLFDLKIFFFSMNLNVDPQFCPTLTFCPHCVFDLWHQWPTQH